MARTRTRAQFLSKASLPLIVECLPDLRHRDFCLCDTAVSLAGGTGGGGGGFLFAHMTSPEYMTSVSLQTPAISFHFISYGLSECRWWIADRQTPTAARHSAVITDQAPGNDTFVVGGD